MITTIQSRGNIQAGSYTTPQLPIDDSLTSIEVRVERNNWHSAGVFEATGYISIDGGPFKRIAYILDVGGDLTFDNGNTRTHSTYKKDLPAGINRVIYADYSVNRNMNTQIDVDLV